MGRIVSIRSETDKDTIQHFTRDQKRIYDAWKNREVKQMSKKEYGQEMKKLEQMFASLCE